MRVVDKEGLRTIIASLTDLSDYATSWDLDPERPVGDTDRAKVSLKLMSVHAIGVDEHRRVYNPPGYPAGSFVTTEIGNREIRVTVYAECYDATVEAAELLDQIRTRIRADAVTAQLNAINLALEWAEKTVMLPTVHDNRLVSAAACDFRFGAIASWVSSVTTAGDWIATVDGNNVIPGTLTP